MKIIILGAGQVGGTLAEHLSQENNDITLVDIDAERLHQLATRLDIRTITGTASYPTVLEQAGIEDADLLIAVTSADEVNMIACQVAHTLFRTRSEEHTSELQSRPQLVCRLLLEKKNGDTGAAAALRRLRCARPVRLRLRPGLAVTAVQPGRL